MTKTVKLNHLVFSQKSKASILYLQLCSRKTLMIGTLQLIEKLDVSWALLLMAETKECLERICRDEKGVNKEVQAACFFLLSN